MKTLPTCCYLCGNDAPAEPRDDWVVDGWGTLIVCPKCLRDGRALRADPSKQNHDGLGGPIDAFWDQTRKCGTCSNDYVFGAEEQQLWYETLGFFVESVPLECQGCRQQMRARKQAQRTMQELLPLAQDADWRQWEEVARASSLLGGSKALEYLRRAKNLCRDSEEKARLESEIVAFKPIPRFESGRGGGSRELVEQLELHYRKEPDTNHLSDEDRASILRAPGLPRSECKLVALIDGMWVRPVPDLADRRQLAYLHGERICPNMPPHESKVLIDKATGILIFLPQSKTRGQTGHYRHGDKIFGPPGPLPWV